MNNYWSLLKSVTFNFDFNYFNIFIYLSYCSIKIRSNLITTNSYFVILFSVLYSSVFTFIAYNGEIFTNISLNARKESATTFKLGTLVNENIASKCLMFSYGFWSNFDWSYLSVYNCLAGVIANSFCLSITPWVLIN